MQLFEHVKEVLSKNESFCKDGKLFKNNVVEAALKLDAELLFILLKDDTTKKHFFTTVEGVQVFDKVKFQQFVSNKQFLPDSYTTFKNKIGLTANGEYLTEANEVVLDFPYKDCVLEGGQTKDDQKRQEIFWNETLAGDEVDRLFEPKVLTNWKMFTTKGEEKVKIDDSTNFLIKGNNLLGLASVLKTKKKAKLIYIDPPFNTGSDSFQYNDRFNHSTWLTFMNNRLQLAKQLLDRKGVICVHCDENEAAHLKVLMDDVFGTENFVNTIVVKTKTAGVSGTHAGKSFQKSHESLHIYARSIEEFQFVEQQYLLLPFDEYLDEMRSEGKSFKYTTVLTSHSKGKHFKTIKDGYGNDIEVYKVDQYETKSVSRLSKDEGIGEMEVFVKYYDKIFTSENAQTSIRTRVQEATDSLDNLYYIEYYPTSGKNKGEKTRVYFVGTKKRLVSWFSNVTELEGDKLYKKEKLGTLWDKLNWNNVTREGGVSFPNGQKPEKLLLLLIQTFTEPGELVVDYHLGSGTTCAVALKSNRQFIGIEQLDYVENDSLQRLKNVIQGDTTGVSDEVNWEGGGSFVYAELAENAASYISKIEALKNSKEAIALWNELKEEPFISYRVSPTEFDANIDSFEQLELDDQKKLLVSTIDKNHLYINYADIEDKSYNISDADKKLNLQFYNR